MIGMHSGTSQSFKVEAVTTAQGRGHVWDALRSMGTMTEGHQREAEARLDCSGSRVVKDEVASVGLGAKQGRQSSFSERYREGNRMEV